MPKTSQHFARGVHRSVVPQLLRMCVDRIVGGWERTNRCADFFGLRPCWSWDHSGWLLKLFQAIGHVSGGHINPAVTCAMMATNNTPIIRGLLYIIVQCLGAVAGSGILRALTPNEIGGNLGTTLLHADLSAPQAFGMEFFLGFILLLVVFAVCDPLRNLGNNAPLAIGFAILVGHLAAIPYTGSSMNPARSFGSSVISGHWEDHWIYWIGPILGGIVAGLVYTYVFAMKAPHEEEVERRTEVFIFNFEVYIIQTSRK
ncbi:hypothetical protein J437_LFUL003509 [Ladona fulva]|uniref:Uncharacterized protein n=1 Tax=Ladona fulva TaxID=123851 RepID=A0A8K0JV23_LADFU|nr:hypothetical protein J437_LFUL003509 [Ladona fulva]